MGQTGYGGRKGALETIVKFLVAGPDHVFPPGVVMHDMQTKWLESFLKMRQTWRKNGLLEARSLYIPPNLLAPSEEPPLIR